MIVEEDGKLFNIDDETGLVTEANLIDEDMRGIQDEYRLGDRVEVVGHLGEIISIVPSYYGLAFGVHFDDDEIGEFTEAQIKRSFVKKAEHETPFDEVLERFATYQELPQYTNDEINRKETEARWLKLRAKSLASNSDLELVDQNELGRIVLVTGTDLETLKELRDNSEESQQYISRFNQYKLADEVRGYGAGLGMKGDASWLNDALDGMEVTETTDTDLAARATEVVAVLSKEQLEDDDFMRVAGSYQYDYLQLTEDQIKKFDTYLARARQERIKDLPESKTASTVDYSLDDTSDIFL